MGNATPCPSDGLFVGLYTVILVYVISQIFYTEQLVLRLVQCILDLFDLLERVLMEEV